MHSQYRCSTGHVMSHTKSSNSSSGHTVVPLELQNSSEVNSKSELLYDWSFTVNQFVLASDPLRPTTRDFLSQFLFPYSLISSRDGPRTENTASLLLRDTGHIENTFPLLLLDVTAHELTCLLSCYLAMCHKILRTQVCTIYCIILRRIRSTWKLS
jgi:hypothetical protein